MVKMMVEGDGDSTRDLKEEVKGSKRKRNVFLKKGSLQQKRVERTAIDILDKVSEQCMVKVFGVQETVHGIVWSI